jgi:predicted kinase
MVVWLNGGFGAGKTVVAQALLDRWPEAILFDPEQIGFMLRGILRFVHPTSDFQDLPLWRELTWRTAAGLVRRYGRPIVVPMTLVEPAYFDEILSELRRNDVVVHHFTLVAEPATLRERLHGRPADASALRWTLERVERCASTLASPAFATHIATDGRAIADIAAEIRERLRAAPEAPR